MSSNSNRYFSFQWHDLFKIIAYLKFFPFLSISTFFWEEGVALKNPLELAIIAPDCSRRQELGLNEPGFTCDFSKGLQSLFELI